MFHSLTELENALNERIQKRDYIIQQGIPLMKHEGLPFDLRVLTQKNPQHSWETTGILGRVAAPGKIITNIHGGGRLATFEELVLPHFKRTATNNWRMNCTASEFILLSNCKALFLDSKRSESISLWIITGVPGSWRLTHCQVYMASVCFQTRRLIAKSNVMPLLTDACPPKGKSKRHPPKIPKYRLLHSSDELPDK